MRRSTRSQSTAPVVVGSMPTEPPLTDENNANVFEAGEMKEKKPRHRITRTQLERLESLYKENSHPTRQIKQSLASEVGLPVKNITIWFQNKRQTVRRRSTRFTARAERDKVSGPIDCTRSTKLLIGLTPDPPSPREDSPPVEVESHLPIDMCAVASPSVGGPVQDLWSYLPSSPLTPTLVHSSVDSVSPSMLLSEDDVFGPVIAANLQGSGRKMKPDLNWACAREEERIRTSACRSPADSSVYSGASSQQPQAFTSAHHQRSDIAKTNVPMAEVVHVDSPILPEYYGLFPLDMLEGASILLSLKHTGLHA